MKFVEKFSQHRLNYLLQNKEKFQCRIYEAGYNPFDTATKMLEKSTNGQIKVDYHQSGGRNFGRFFAAGGVSLQYICREIRHTIASEYYVDLDMVNAHPVILRFICQQHDIDCERLNSYIENREQYIEDVINENKTHSREDVKRIFLSLINGGAGDYNSLTKPTRFLRRFKIEVTSILEELCSLYPKEYDIRKKSNPSNPMGSTVNAIMCDYENKILQCVLKFYQDKGIIKENCVLCFDGIMIPKNAKIMELIPECEQYVLEKTKIVVSLKIKPMDEGFDIPNDIDDYVEFKAFDPQDNFCWLEFDEKYRGKVFTSLDEVIEKTRHDLNRVMCKVEQGCGFIVKKTDCKDNLMDIIDRGSNFTDMFFEYYEGDKQIELPFKKYIQLFSNLLNRYRSIDFAPNNTDPLVFNLWSGFKAHEIDNINVEAIQLILTHIKEVYCSDCEESYEYFLDLIYYIIKYPGKPLGVATFIFSKKHGSGKNILLDFLQEYVFGNNISYYTTGLETVLEKHNHMLKNKKIVIVDELASSSDKFVANFDKMKSMMTGPFISINPKGTNQYSIKNVLAWFLISNNDDCLRLEASDRRYFCLSVSEKYIGNKEYFKKLSSTFSPETGNIFFSYLMKRGDERDVNIRTPPMNAFKKSIISKGWSTPIRFLFGLEGEESEFKATALYIRYKMWCIDNHEKLKSSTKFYNDIETHITKTKKESGMVYDLATIKID